nr:amino acid adenylation domain-containing protein [uncultured Lachnoclostridium sp.]
MNNQHIIQRILKKSFEKNAERNAICYQNHYYTYEKIDQYSSFYAEQILKNSPAGKVISILMKDTFEAICAIVGVIKAGKCFMPVDVKYPKNMVKNMVKGHADFVLTDDAGSIMLEDIISRENYVVCKRDETIGKNIAFTEDCDEQSPLYIYFSSGTTGLPKGIVGRNIGMYHFISWEVREFQITSDFHVSQFTPICHDPFLRDTLVPLAVGACIYIPEGREEILSAVKLTDFLNRNQINLVHATPSLFRILMQNEAITKDDFRELTYVLLAGELVNGELLERWYELFDERIQLVNMYGPTETTLAKMFYWIHKQDVKRNSIPIGKAISGTQIFLVDENGERCCVGQEGEIYIRTPYRTLGYLDDPEKTAEKFIPNPFGTGENKEDKVFKTGDRGRMLPDGNVEFVGRVDRQIKIRGFRVELDAIQTVLEKYEDIISCAVKHFQIGETIRIVAYYTSQRKLNDLELEEHMKKTLPEYMCPSAFIKLESMPVTSNNKLDYSALELPENLETEPYVEPADETEAKLEKVLCEVLKREKFSVVEDFMHGGVSSLNIMLMINRVYENFSYELSLAQVFSGLSIRQLANTIKECGVKEEQTMLDVEDGIIEKTLKDARYIILRVDGQDRRVLFSEEEDMDMLSSFIKQNFNEELYPDYIMPMSENASLLEDEVDYDEEEFQGEMTLPGTYSDTDMEARCKLLIERNRTVQKAAVKEKEWRKEPYSSAQIIRSNFPENNVTFLFLHGMLDEEALQEAFVEVLKGEELLRCVKQSEYSFRCYGEIGPIDIPVLDISMYRPECQNRLVNKELAQYFYLTPYDERDTFCWRVALIKCTESKHILCFCAEHLIFDGYSREIFENEFKKFYQAKKNHMAVKAKKRESFFSYNEKVKQQTEDKMKDADYLKKEDFFQEGGQAKGLPTQGEISIYQHTISLDALIENHPEKEQAELISEVSYKLFLHVMAKLDGSRKIPFLTISEGRKLGEYSCFDCVGEFIDYVPYIGDVEEEDDYQEYLQYLKKIESDGIRITDIFELSGEKVKFQGYLSNMKAVYNYQNYRIVKRQEWIKKSEEKIVNLKGLLNYIVRPKESALEIILVYNKMIPDFQELLESTFAEII